MSIVSNYFKRNNHKLLIEKVKNKYYAISKNIYKNTPDFIICLESGVCNLITKNKEFEFVLSTSDLENLKSNSYF